MLRKVPVEPDTVYYYDVSSSYPESMLEGR